MNKLSFSVLLLGSLLMLAGCGSNNSTPQYKLTLSSSPSEGGSVSPAEQVYDEGNTADITATPNPEWLFVRWEGDYTGTSTSASVTMDSDKSITGIFEKKEYALTVNTDGQGTVDEQVVSSKPTDYESGTEVELTATPDADWKFVEWQGAVTGSDNPAQVTVDQAKQITAVFEKKSYSLDITIQGSGAVDETVVQAKDYEAGTMVELTANPATGWKFKEWGGDLTGTDNPQTITVDEAKDVFAVFQRKSYTLTVNTTGDGSVAKSPDYTTYRYGETVDLEANPATDWKFVEWKGDLTGTTNPQQITVDKAKQVTAVFEKKQYALTTNTTGQGAIDEQVVSSKATDYESGTVVELTANPATGWEFIEWQGDLTGSTNPQQITIDDPKDVTAVFEKKSYSLTINTTGNGSVTQSPDQSTYEHGTTVELGANAASGWEFVEWQGDLSGSTNPDQITFDGPKDVTAVFEEKAFKLAQNGVTIICDVASVGDTGTINGTTYTKRSKSQITPANAPTSCTSGISDMSNLFDGAGSFNGDIGHWDVSSVTNMFLMFDGANSFTGDLSSWDVSSVTNMGAMFRNASSFNGDLNSWDVGNVTDMSSMFQYAHSFNQGLNNWDVSSVTDMTTMFAGDASGNSSFNGNISNWDVSNVTSMIYMFRDAVSFSGDLSSWDVSSVTDMRRMFQDAIVFNSDISGWTVSNVTDMSSMFKGADSFNSDLSNWDVGNVTNMRTMFSGAKAFNSDIGSWDVSSVTDMDNMFFDADAFNQNLNGWDVSNVKGMSSMFYQADKFNGDISGWDVSSVESMGSMFRLADQFNVDIGSWDVSSVTSMGYMFNNSYSFNQDLSGWCVSNIASVPTDFSTGSPLTNGNKPVWGTCPSP